MFFYAYREFVRALGEHDTAVLKKMAEPKLFQVIQENQNVLESLNSHYVCVQDDIKLKMKLLDMQMVQGIYLDRRKNLKREFYSVDDA